MKGRRLIFLLGLAVFAFTCFTLNSVDASAQVLKNGMKGDEVIRLQENLKQLGYFNSSSTGYYGELTEQAVKNLQKDYGQTQDGIAGNNTLSLIDKLLAQKSDQSMPSVLKKGMKGKDVVSLQSDLKELGYFKNECTGYYGELTEQAVKNLQAQYGYIADGIAGKNTIALIKRLISFNASGGTSPVLKKGMTGSGITALQNDLKSLGFFSGECTGYYGSITEQSVKNLQKKYGYTQDGIVGRSTFQLIDKLLGRIGGDVSRGAAERGNYKASWFDEVSSVFKRGLVATVYDVDTGLSFNVKRTYGTNHADCEPLTAQDTQIMKQVYGGSWSWERRAIIVTVGGKKYAASMNGMPHAGVEKYDANITVNSRSGGYGTGTNYDAVKGNEMDGHFCIHFYNSRTHGTNRVDESHQAMVKKAAEWAEKNL